MTSSLSALMPLTQAAMRRTAAVARAARVPLMASITESRLPEAEKSGRLRLYERYARRGPRGTQPHGNHLGRRHDAQKILTGHLGNVGI
jgi:hypothetical protein